MLANAAYPRATLGAQGEGRALAGADDSMSSRSAGLAVDLVGRHPWLTTTTCLVGDRLRPRPRHQVEMRLLRVGDAQGVVGATGRAAWLAVYEHVEIGRIVGATIHPRHGVAAADSFSGAFTLTTGVGEGRRPGAQPQLSSHQCCWGGARADSKRGGVLLMPTWSRILVTVLLSLMTAISSRRPPQRRHSSMSNKNALLSNSAHRNRFR